MPCRNIPPKMPKTFLHHSSSSSNTITLFKFLDIPEEAVGTNLIDQENLPHPSIGWQAGAFELPLISWSEDDEHLALLLLPQPHNFLLKVQVLGSVVGEHHN